MIRFASFVFPGKSVNGAKKPMFLPFYCNDVFPTGILVLLIRLRHQVNTKVKGLTCIWNMQTPSDLYKEQPVGKK